MSKPPIFVDSGFWFALTDRGDAYHARALGWLREATSQARSFVTTSGILVELGDGWHRAGAWQRFGPIIDKVRSDPNYAVEHVDVALFDAALALRKQHADKHWGLTDCQSFVVMKRKRLVDALSCDQHFNQAGFRALLLIDPP